MQTKVIPVTQFMNAIQPMLRQLDSPTVNQQNCNASNLCTLTDQQGSIKSILDQINQNLINLDSSVNQLNRIHSIDKTKYLASLVAKIYVCLGLVFLFIGTYRYFQVQTVLQAGKFPQSRIAIGFTTLLVSVLSISTFSLMIKFNF